MGTLHNGQRTYHPPILTDFQKYIMAEGQEWDIFTADYADCWIVGLEQNMFELAADNGLRASPNDTITRCINLRNPIIREIRGKIVRFA
jgi:hypothetical protein